MAKTSSLYLASLEPTTGSLFISIGLMDILKSRYEKVAFFRPVIKQKFKEDGDITFMREHYSLTQGYEESYCFNATEVEKLIVESPVEERTLELLELADRHPPKEPVSFGNIADTLPYLRSKLLGIAIEKR